MVFVLIFYLRKWIQNYSIFVTLGIRRKALWTIAGLEIGLGFVFSQKYIGGVIVGNGVLLLFRKIVGNMVAIRSICHMQVKQRIWYHLPFCSLSILFH